jgi:hypothetical protein
LIALPFVIALGFALAAISVLLVQRFGDVFGYWMIADGLTLIGVIATIAVRSGPNNQSLFGAADRREPQRARPTCRGRKALIELDFGHP